MSRLTAVFRSVCLAIGLSFLVAARASPVTFEFSGALYAVEPGLTGVFAAGDRFSGSFSYESSTPFLDGTTDEAKVYDALLGFSVTIGAYSLVWAPPGDGLNPVTVSNDSFGDDGLAVQAFRPFFESGLCALGVNAVGVVFALIDSTASVFSSALALPGTLDLAAFDLARLYVGFSTALGPALIEGDVSALSVSNKVPEPSGLVVVVLAFVLGLVVTSAARRAQTEIPRRLASSG